MPRAPTWRCGPAGQKEEKPVEVEVPKPKPKPVDLKRAFGSLGGAKKKAVVERILVMAY